MTPINDSTSQMVQFCLRNDTEADAKTIDIIAFDRAVTLVEHYLLLPPSSLFLRTLPFGNCFAERVFAVQEK
ncbi:hypothetical protein QUA13_19430 [Microcoleus sp. S28C3]|uniref:hypothetical protein n=1 Tax=Microcoleus sp. S28C3 TaxID=3055414 RepID=UPI002FD00B05